MNTNSLTKAELEEVKLVIEKISEIDEMLNEIPLDIAVIDDWKNIAAYEELRKLKSFNWSTEAVWSLFIKNLKYFWENCEDTIAPNAATKLMNDLFTLPKQNLSLPNIALIYTASNYKVMESSNLIEGDSQLSDYLKDCMIAIRNQSTFKKETENFSF